MKKKIQNNQRPFALTFEDESDLPDSFAGCSRPLAASA